MRFYDQLEREITQGAGRHLDYVIYVHIDVNLDERDGFAAARPAIVRNEIGGALA